MKSTLHLIAYDLDCGVAWWAEALIEKLEERLKAEAKMDERKAA